MSGMRLKSTIVASLAAIVLAGAVACQDVGSNQSGGDGSGGGGSGGDGVIPNECCPEFGVAFFHAPTESENPDAGQGETAVSVQGTTDRRIGLDPGSTGLRGVVALYHRWFVVDVTRAAWDGPMLSPLRGAQIPVPDMAPETLFSDPAESGKGLQPRPGTMPGLYLYTEDNATFYQYGGPLESGANPLTTAVFSGGQPLTGGSGGNGGSGRGDVAGKPSVEVLPATLVYTNNLSGSQLWRYHQGTINEYFEIKYVDGSVARFDKFNPWSSSYSGSGTLLRVTKVTDPFDNTAIYVYDAQNRLIRIHFPSGLTKKFDWDDTWGWTGGSHDMLTMSYEQDRFDGQGKQALPERTWGIAFQRLGAQSNRRHFGSRIYRICGARREMVHDVFGAAYSSPPATSMARAVHEFDYSTSTNTLSETHRVDPGTGFSQTLGAVSGLADQPILVSAFSASPGTVLSQTRSMTGERLDFTYPTSGFRTTDLLSTFSVMRGIEATDKGGTVRRVEYDRDSGHIYSVITTPSANFAGRPRHTHASSENAGIGGIAASAVEPERFEIYNIFDSTCVCQKPIQRRIKSTVNGQLSERVYDFVYDSTSKLLKERRAPNPEAGSGPFAAQVTWTYTYEQAKTVSQDWGAWLIKTESTPDGNYEYEYGDWLDRSDASNHGRIAGSVKRRIKDIRRQTTLDAAAVTSSAWVEETIFLNLSNSPGGVAPSPAVLNVRGQPRLSIDGDGVVSILEYTAEGWLLRGEVSGADRTSFLYDDYGDVTTVVENAAAAGGLQGTWAVVPDHALGTASSRTSASASATRASEYYFDRFGNLASHRRQNKSSTDSEPERHGGTVAAARPWVDFQWHYLHTRLDSVYRDRQPLDEAAGPDRYLPTTFVYSATTARLDYVVNPNGSKSYYEFDGFGTLYRKYVEDPAGARTARGPKRFVNPFLEVVGYYEFTGAAHGSNHLWTILERNGAGAIVKLTEPELTATVPAGYSPANGINYSTGGAEHTFELDVMGRVTQVEIRDGTDLLAKRILRYDQFSRQIWQEDEARLRSGNSSVVKDVHRLAWEFVDGRRSQLGIARQTGVADRSYSYWPAGLLKQVAQAGDVVDYAYHGGTSYVSSVDRTDIDPVVSQRVTATAYEVDAFGQVLKIREGANLPVSGQLEHGYSYNSLGLVDRYEGPDGKLQKFLPDALGRVVEHARVSGLAAIMNFTTFVDMGQADGSSMSIRYDDNLNQTRSHNDFAGRPFIVQNPGSPGAPSAADKHRAMSLYAEYDEASRMTEVYDGDYGVTHIVRDGPGRVIQRYVTLSNSKPSNYDMIAGWNGQDWLRRDALGRIEQHDYYTILGNINGVGQTYMDSIGRVWNERYNFALAASNVIEVTSGYAGGEAYRSSLDYLDGLQAFPAFEQKLGLEFTHDTRGRLGQLSWDTSPNGSGSASLLADYGWAGGIRRTRELHLAGASNPVVDSTFSFDAFGRLTQVKDELTVGTASPVVLSQYDYGYDKASNLVKEKYAKVDGSAGDRFAYDDFRRLSEAWQGVDSSTMAAAANPTGFNASTMHEHLTYGLDGAHNRTSTAVQDASSGGPLVSNYTIQGGAPQGPSNRYEVVSEPAVGGVGATVPYEYDNRGNLRCDGKYVYTYDYRNRLTEVWRILPDSATAMAAATTSSASASGGDRYAEVQQGGFDGARESVKSELPNLYNRLIHEHKDPTFRSRLRATIDGGIITFVGASSGGGGGIPSFIPVSGQLELTAVFLYDGYDRRTVSIWVGITEWFHVFDGWREVEECGLVVGHAVPQKQFIWGASLDELIGYRYKDVYGGNPTGQWSDYHVVHGGQDTSAKLIDSDGAVVETYEYRPHGAVSVFVGSSTAAQAASSVGLPFLWKGMRLDALTGLVYMRNRYYSPAIGRFLSRDPIGNWGDSINNGNGYAYVGERGLVFGDRFGLQGKADRHKPPEINVRTDKGNLVSDIHPSKDPNKKATDKELERAAASTARYFMQRTDVASSDEYNCHSLTFLGGRGWLGTAGAAAILRDNFHPVSKDDVKKGDVVAYYGWVCDEDGNWTYGLTHTGTVLIVAGKKVIVKSKMGQGGQGEHDIGSVPDSYMGEPPKNAGVDTSGKDSGAWFFRSNGGSNNVLGHPVNQPTIATGGFA